MKNNILKLSELNQKEQDFKNNNPNLPEWMYKGAPDLDLNSHVSRSIDSYFSPINVIIRKIILDDLSRQDFIETFNISNKNKIAFEFLQFNIEPKDNVVYKINGFSNGIRYFLYNGKIYSLKNINNLKPSEFIKFKSIESEINKIYDIHEVMFHDKSKPLYYPENKSKYVADFSASSPYDFVKMINSVIISDYDDSNGTDDSPIADPDNFSPNGLNKLDLVTSSSKINIYNMEKIK